MAPPPPPEAPDAGPDAPPDTAMSTPTDGALDRRAPDATPADVPRDLAADLAAPDAPTDRARPDAPGDLTPYQFPDVAPRDDGPAPVWSPPQPAEDDPLDGDQILRVAVDPRTGDAVVVVYDSSIKTMRYDARAARWSPPYVIENRAAPYWPAVAMDGLGHVFVVWDNRDATGELAGIWARRSDDGGATWGQPARIQGGHAERPVLAVARNGRARVTWERISAGGVSKLFTAYFDGSAWTEGQLVMDVLNPDDNQSSRTATVAIDPDGNGFFAWTQAPSEQRTSVPVQVWVARFGGAEVETPQNFGVGWEGAQVVMSPDGRHAITRWQQPPDMGAGSFARRWTQAGDWTPNEKIADVGDSPGIAIDNTGAVTAVFEVTNPLGAINVAAVRYEPGRAAGGRQSRSRPTI